MVQGKNGGENSVLLHDLVNHLLVKTHPVLAQEPFRCYLYEALDGGQLANERCCQSEGLMMCNSLDLSNVNQALGFH